MRSFPILDDTYYHLYNRGSQKQKLFYDKADYARFQFLLLYLQSEKSFLNAHRRVKGYLKSGSYAVEEKEVKEIEQTRFVELINFCIMPNHFHVTVRNIGNDGISRYMHKVSNAYAKYFNTRHEKTGHVFQGAYKARLVESDEQLTYLSAYIHRNPCDLDGYRSDEFMYPWSSYRDYKNNRWGELLLPEVVLTTFTDFDNYQYFVNVSGAKVFNTEC